MWPRYWTIGTPCECSTLAQVDLLESGDQGQRHRLQFVVAGPEDQERGHLLAERHAPFLGLGRRLLGDRHRAGRRRDTVRIEDHDHAAVAENGVAREHRDVAQDRRHRLDHDFLGVEHPVDDDAEAVGADLADDDELLLVHQIMALAFRLVVEMQDLAQNHQRQQAVTQAQDRCLVDHLDRAFGICRGPDQFEHADLRNGEALAAAFDDQGRKRWPGSAGS